MTGRRLLWRASRLPLQGRVSPALIQVAKRPPPTTRDSVLDELNTIIDSTAAVDDA